MGVGGFGGGEVRAGNRVGICPTGQASMAFIPEQTLLFSAVDARVLTAGAGVSVGVLAADTDVAQIIPTGGFGFEYVRVSGTIQSAGIPFLGIPFLGIPALRDSGAADTVIGVAHFGVGVVLSRLVSIKPVVGFGFGSGTTDASFAIVASLGFR